jgi:hypothetical protein
MKKDVTQDANAWCSGTVLFDGGYADMVARILRAISSSWI